jgi:hypothetical protein
MYKRAFFMAFAINYCFPLFGAGKPKIEWETRFGHSSSNLDLMSQVGYGTAKTSSIRPFNKYNDPKLNLLLVQSKIRIAFLNYN